MSLKRRRTVGRRRFLKGAAAGAAGLVTSSGQTAAAGGQQAGPSTPAAPATEAARVDVFHTDRPGSDYMVDVVKSLGFEYVAANPGSSFRALHESLINYGGNTAPELLTCCHEESSVAMAHGYAKIVSRRPRGPDHRRHRTTARSHASDG